MGFVKSYLLWFKPEDIVNPVVQYLFCTQFYVSDVLVDNNNGSVEQKYPVPTTGLLIVERMCVSGVCYTPFHSLETI